MPNDQHHDHSSHEHHKAPAGSHVMPDGTVMSGHAHQHGSADHAARADSLAVGIGHHEHISSPLHERAFPDRRERIGGYCRTTRPLAHIVRVCGD